MDKKLQITLDNPSEFQQGFSAGYQAGKTAVREQSDLEYVDTHTSGMVYGYFCMADALVKRAASEPTFEALMNEVAVQMWTYNPAQAKALGLPEPNPGNGTEDGIPFA